ANAAATTTQATGWSQEVESETTLSSGGLGVGKPQVGPLTVELPLSSYVFRLLQPLNAGVHLPQVSVEMCLPTQAAGACLMQVDLEDAAVSLMDYSESGTAASEATAKIAFNPASETLTSRTATGERSVTYNLGLAQITRQGPATGAPAGDLTYVTTLSGGTGLDTQTWSHHIETPVASTSGGPIVGKTVHQPVTAAIRSGEGTVELLWWLLRGLSPGSVQITGCSADPCTQTLTLGRAFVTKVTMGSPLLTDTDTFAYSTIQWNRTDDQGQARTSWDLLQNRL
ncbi:MAG: hypothetical protein JWP82_80, partial [Humibacillus sp.]|nr:hypothetical protein [Humibacillus sp.]